MLSEQEQADVLRPFQVLVRKYESELETAKESGDLKNEERDEKITQLEKGKIGVEEFIQGLTPRVKSPDAEFKELVDGLEADRATQSGIFNDAYALYNYKYTPGQKIEMNRRVIAVNVSRLISNTDMDVLQKQWSAILGMKNDKELEAAKKRFEDRLLEWEGLIAKKRNGSR